MLTTVFWMQKVVPFPSGLAVTTVASLWPEPRRLAKIAAMKKRANDSSVHLI